MPCTPPLMEKAFLSHTHRVVLAFKIFNSSKSPSLFSSFLSFSAAQPSHPDTPQHWYTTIYISSDHFVRMTPCKYQDNTNTPKENMRFLESNKNDICAACLLNMFMCWIQSISHNSATMRCQTGSEKWNDAFKHFFWIQCQSTSKNTTAS